MDLQRLTSKAGGVAQDVGNRSVDGTEGAGGSLPPEFLDRLKVLLDIASQQLRLTQAEFLYTPSQLALGTWWSLTEDEGEGKSGAHPSASASASSTLTSEERTKLRELLQRWIDEKESLLSTTTVSSSSKDLHPSLQEIANQVTTYVRQGAALQEELRSPACVERVKSIDLALRAQAEQQQQQQQQQGDGGVDVDEAAEQEEEEEEEEEEDAKGVGAVLGSGAGDAASRRKRKSAPGTEADGQDGDEQEEGGQPSAAGGGAGESGAGKSTTAGGAAPKRIKVVRQAE